MAAFSGVGLAGAAAGAEGAAGAGALAGEAAGAGSGLDPRIVDRRLRGSDRPIGRTGPAGYPMGARLFRGGNESSARYRRGNRGRRDRLLARRHGWGPRRLVGLQPRHVRPGRLLAHRGDESLAGARLQPERADRRDRAHAAQDPGDLRAWAVRKD